MNFIRKEDIEQLLSLVQDASRISILGHTHPDGDALGATTALALFLREKWNKDVVVIFSDTPADTLQFILSPEVPCLFRDRDAAASEARIRESDLLFLVDCNSFARTEGLETAARAASARKVLIDHHLNPEREAFALCFSTPDISSASELLYWMLRELSPQLSIPVGTALLTGMTTDTNNFANSVYPSTFRMASELIAEGVDRDRLLQQIYNSYRENRVRLMGYMQNEGLTVLPEGAAYMVLTKEIQQRFDLQDGESEGLVNVPLTIGKVRLSVLLKEDEGHFRVSIRSKRGTSAQKLAQRCFHGGGHENASGGKLFIGEDIPSADAAPAYLEKLLKTYLQ